jgi:hypothetical protein
MMPIPAPGHPGAQLRQVPPSAGLLGEHPGNMPLAPPPNVLHALPPRVSPLVL